jgi:nucleotide-binding universal stress UspA family protein
VSARRAVVWVAEGTWEACVDAARDLLPHGCEITLLHVTPPDVVEAASGAVAGLLGRGRRPHAPAQQLATMYEHAASELLAAAAQRLGREARTETRSGRLERSVLAAVADADADLLVVARDRDASHPGPHSIGHATRFVVDHAPCMVLLVWMPGGPHSAELPPEPPRRRGPAGEHSPAPRP